MKYDEAYRCATLHEAIIVFEIECGIDWMLLMRHAPVPYRLDTELKGGCCNWLDVVHDAAYCCAVSLG